jgi:hypothetical protein
MPPLEEEKQTARSATRRRAHRTRSANDNAHVGNAPGDLVLGLDQALLKDLLNDADPVRIDDPGRQKARGVSKGALQ